MAGESKLLIDGTTDFSGGLDTNRSSFAIGQNQFVLSVNCSIPATYGGISSRAGLRNLFIEFEAPAQEDIYRNGHIQGEGWYFDGQQEKYLVSVDGWIFEFWFISQYTMRAKIRNIKYRNNPNNLYCWITRLPFGAMVMDGESAALYLTKNKIRRTDPRKNEIGSGRMGVYVQNRFFYVRDDSRNIYASEINNPTSLQEAYDANIFGFIAPEDENYILAIGKNKTISRDAVGGNLAFATCKDIYSADVRGDRSNWGKIAGQGVGFVDNTVPDIGAISSFSFEPFNGNIYFRNSSFGLLSTKQAQYQFINNDSYYSHSIEANLFFERDTKFLLSKCYTRGYKSKLFTTVAPEVKNNFIYWNGLVVYAPDIYYSSQEKAPRRYESVYTGIRPWCVTVSDTDISGEKMLIHSYDHDGVNRLYLYDDASDFDTDKDFKRVEIESKILTRSYAHKNDSVPKRTDQAFYSLRDLTRDLDLKILTRTSDSGPFTKQWEIVHKVTQCCIGKTKLGNNCFKPKAIHPEHRELVNVSQDPDDKSKNSMVKDYFSRQDLFLMKGPFTLKRWVRIASIQEMNKNVFKEQECDSLNEYPEFRLYDYKISK